MSIHRSSPQACRKEALQYEAYTKSPWGLRREELIWRQMQPWLPADAAVLDIGCGLGSLAVRLAALGHEVTAVDQSLVMLAALKGSLSNSLDNRVTVLASSAEEYLEDAAHSGRRFGFIVCHNLLEYAEDPMRLLCRLHDVASPNAVMSLVLVNPLGEVIRMAHERHWRRARVTFSRGAYQSPTFGRMVRLYSRSKLTRMLRQSGWGKYTWSALGLAPYATDASDPCAGIADEISLSLQVGTKDVGALTHYLASPTSL